MGWLTDCMRTKCRRKRKLSLSLAREKPVYSAFQYYGLYNHSLAIETQPLNCLLRVLKWHVRSEKNISCFCEYNIWEYVYLPNELDASSVEIKILPVCTGAIVDINRYITYRPKKEDYA